MKIIITAREALDRGIWDDICGIFGLSEWCINEGQMDTDHEFELTPKQAEGLGLVGRPA